MKLGLALSGGGFRATLYHLGLIRFLHDANLLPSVNQITSVSGGSVVAAHLALNWGRYTGSTSEFEAAADELLAFTQLDVRNRIIRRVPFCVAMHLPRRLLGYSNRKLSRTGLLEYLYEKHLFGDTSLFELPESPQLHILSTNLSEGCLCSFNRNGLLVMRRRRPGNSIRVDQTDASLATVAMAVTASSAFPAFFPPLEVSEGDVGTTGEFGRQSFTDGGIFDNLGVRMFHYLDEFLAADQSPPDGVLISDVGKRISIKSQQQRAGGVIRTGIRASDILMDRVWQLETEKFKDTPEFIFARAIDIVDRDEDPTALHPEIQRQLPSIRTDFDRFSRVEISSLVRHGYCVGRKVCRAHPDLFGSELPAGPPWNPYSEVHGMSSPSVHAQRPNHAPTVTTAEARTLQKSHVRRIWSTLFDYRDWVSYIYVPIIVPILFLLPYFVFKSYERSQRVSQIVESLAQGSRDLEQMTRLMEGPVEPWVGENAEDLRSDEMLDLSGYLVLQDLRIVDLRSWNPAAGRDDASSFVYGYRRLKVQKRPDASTNTPFRVSVLALSPSTQVRFPAQQLKPKLYSRALDSAAHGEKLIHWEVGADFAKVPAGESVDLIYEHLSPGLFLRDGVGSTTLSFDVEAETVELSRWLLLPQGKQYRTFQMVRYKTGKPETAENVKVVTQYVAGDFTIVAFKLLALKPGYTYEVTWFYR